MPAMRSRDVSGNFVGPLAPSPGATGDASPVKDSPLEKTMTAARKTRVPRAKRGSRERKRVKRIKRQPSRCIVVFCGDDGYTATCKFGALKSFKARGLIELYSTGMSAKLFKPTLDGSGFNEGAKGIAVSARS